MTGSLFGAAILPGASASKGCEDPETTQFDACVYMFGIFSLGFFIVYLLKFLFNLAKDGVTYIRYKIVGANTKPGDRTTRRIAIRDLGDTNAKVYFAGSYNKDQDGNVQCKHAVHLFSDCRPLVLMREKTEAHNRPTVFHTGNICKICLKKAR
jgi:hypothetical protein